MCRSLGPCPAVPSRNFTQGLPLRPCAKTCQVGPSSGGKGEGEKLERGWVKGPGIASALANPRDKRREEDGRNNRQSKPPTNLPPSVISKKTLPRQ